MKHTQGPWDVQNKGNLYGRSARHEVVEGISEGGDKPLPTIVKMPDLSDRSYANARLISAAPELLDALKEVVYSLEDGSTTSLQIKLEANLPQIEKAIAKAEGRGP